MRDAQPVKGGVNRMKKKVIAVIAAVLIVVAAAAFIYSAEQRHQAEYERTSKTLTAAPIR